MHSRERKSRQMFPLRVTDVCCVVLCPGSCGPRDVQSDFMCSVPGHSVVFVRCVGAAAAALVFAGDPGSTVILMALTSCKSCHAPRYFFSRCLILRFAL